MNYEILVNKYNKVYQETIDQIKLVKYQGEYQNFPLFVEEKTLEMFLLLKDYVYKKKNIEVDLEDAYRSPEDSQKLYDLVKEREGRKHADKYVALPYTSEHNIGLAIDYVVKINDSFIDNSPEYENLSESIYINKIAHKFGFIIRYPKTKENITGYNYEPWHLRYVGIDLATYLFNNNLTLEERFELDKQLFENPIKKK